MSVKRFDTAPLGPPVRHDNGFVDVDAFLTRTGVFVYRNRDGTERREYRPPAEVFKADSLASFKGAVLTNDHPLEGLVNSQNAKRLQVGHLIDGPRQDGALMRATIRVTDAATIADMEGGKLQISNGYVCDLEETPGISPEGERYDAVQKDIRGNHVALVQRGRAGADVRARMDAADAEMVSADFEGPQKKERTVKITVDGIEVEVADATAQLIEKERAAQKTALEAAKASADKATARADAAEKDLKDAKAALAEAPAKARAAFETRAALESSAKAVMGAKFKTDGLSDDEIRKAVAATQVGPEVKLDDKSAGYLEALFDQAVRKQADETTAKNDVADVVAKTKPVHAEGKKPMSFHEVANQAFKSAGNSEK